MKKNIFISSALAVACVPSFALAASASDASGVIGTNPAFSNATCTTLDANPSINNSANVKMAWNCLTSGPVALASCHTAGLTKARSQKVVCGTDSSIVGAAAACDGSDPASAATAASGFKVVSTGGSTATIWAASTGGGSLGAATITAGTLCDTAGAKALAVVQTY